MSEVGWTSGASRDTRRVIVAMTGATGSAIGVRILEVLAALGHIETHLVMSPSATLTLQQETDMKVKDVTGLATEVHKHSAIGDSLASGSFDVHSMIVAPCSVKTMSAIAGCHADNLISRAADVQLKEGRPVALVFREAPLHVGHLRQMLAAAEAGAVIIPPVPAFYQRPQSVADIVDHIARRVLMRVGLREVEHYEWLGLRRNETAPENTRPNGR